MIKKLAFLLCVFALICSSVFATQQTFVYSSQEVHNLLTLATMTGTPVPSMTYPITSEFILQMLDIMDISRLSGPALKLYQNLKSSLENQSYLIKTRDEKYGIKLNVTVLGAEIWKGPEVTDNFEVPFRSPESFFAEIWHLPRLSEFKDRIPVASAEAILNFSDYFTGDFRFDLGINDKTAKPITSTINWDFLFDAGFVEHDLVTKSYASLGFNNVNLIVGRDKLSAGSGKTGNLELGENQLYQDFAKLSALSYPFSYDFTLSVYDSYPEGWSEEWTSYDDYQKNLLNYFKLDGPVKAAYIHRFSVSLFKRATLSFYEGAMAYGDGILSDPRVLNPFMFIHNTFSFKSGNVNNFFGLEAEVNLPANLKIDIQAILDQFRTSNETTSSGENAYGILANLSGSWVAGDGILSAYAEYVFNSPGLYLKEYRSLYPLDNSYPYDKRTEYYKLDLITGYNNSLVSEFAYLGYKYGGNLHAFGLGASYLWHGHTFSADLFFLSKGEFGIGKGEQRALSDTEYHYEKTGIVKNSLSFTLGAGGTLYKGLDYKVKAGLVGKEFQFALAFSVHPLEFFKQDTAESSH